MRASVDARLFTLKFRSAHPGAAHDLVVVAP